jgi:hypothetical protein
MYVCTYSTSIYVCFVDTVYGEIHEEETGREGERRSKSGGELAERCIACVDELRIKAGVLLRGAQRMQTVQLWPKLYRR